MLHLSSFIFTPLRFSSAITSCILITISCQVGGYPSQLWDVRSRLPMVVIAISPNQIPGEGGGSWTIIWNENGDQLVVSLSNNRDDSLLILGTIYVMNEWLTWVKECTKLLWSTKILYIHIKKRVTYILNSVLHIFWCFIVSEY